MKKILSVGLMLLGLAQINAQVATINEDFENFTTGTDATAWPQNDWNRVQNTSGPWVYADNKDSNTFIYYYSFFTSNVSGYVVTPQIVAPDGTSSISFTTYRDPGSFPGTNATLEVGLVDNPTDMTTFTSLGSAINLTDTETTYSYVVPASTQQYIAFKITGDGQHTAARLDNVVYDKTDLATSEIGASNDVKFATTTDNNALQFVSKKYTVDNVQIFSANGQKVAAGKVNNNQFSIATLNAGVYFILIETKDGAVVKSKFIKK